MAASAAMPFPLSRPLLGAAACLPAWLLVLAFAPEAALRGWLAAFCFAAGITLGALVLSVMMRLIPGLWNKELQPFSDRLAGLVPLAALIFLPVLVGASWLYPWDGSEGKGAFREIWMALPVWSIRSVAFLLFVSGFSFLLLSRTETSTRLHIGGLVLFVLFFVPISLDWFLFLDPEAHFSGFALSVLSLFFLGALCVAIPLAFLSGHRIERPEILGSLLMSALLAWSYFAFMQYFITWSDNLPFGVRWYRDRGQGVWGLVEYGFAAFRLLPLGMLLFTPVRQGARWLVPLCLVVLAGNALEALWLIVPAGGWPEKGGAESGAALAALGAIFAGAAMILAGFSLVGRRGARP
ncbi:MAG: hypothetical protein INR68_15060 [Methylobacterium mesophilicum]|nr:hypothetical protein [Methylobacterium mesophilicum]